MQCRSHLPDIYGLFALLKCCIPGSMSWCVCSSDAPKAEREKAERELLQKIKEALPEATEPWLVQIVLQKLQEESSAFGRA